MSARNDRTPVRFNSTKEEDHPPRVDASDPLYMRLMGCPLPSGVKAIDQHMFACILTAASLEQEPLSETLGLGNKDILFLLRRFFPGFDMAQLKKAQPGVESDVTETNEDILALLLEYLSSDLSQTDRQTAVTLCKILAARTARPGHLWVAMGFFERPELTASIRRHLPSLAEANSQNMRWKRFLFKQLCDRQGGTLCKAPNCGVCSDYAVCFAPEEES